MSSFTAESNAPTRPDAPSAAGAFAIPDDIAAARRAPRRSPESRIPNASQQPKACHLERSTTAEGWSSRSSSGFTLIELLVVVVIVGVLAAALVIAIGSSSERQLANASDRFQALIGHACNTAELTGREIGVAVSATGYVFSRLDRDEWRVLDNANELRGRSWPTGMRVELTRTDRALALVSAGRETPQLVCFSSGEMTPFALVLALGDATAHYRIEGKDDGTLKSERVETTQ